MADPLATESKPRPVVHGTTALLRLRALCLGLSTMQTALWRGYHFCCPRTNEDGWEGKRVHSIRGQSVPADPHALLKCVVCPCLTTSNTKRQDSDTSALWLQLLSRLQGSHVAALSTEQPGEVLVVVGQALLDCVNQHLPLRRRKPGQELIRMPAQGRALARHSPPQDHHRSAFL